MKPSAYNHFIEFRGKILAFNCITESFFLVEPEKAETYQEIINNPDLYSEDLPDFISRLKKDGFVTDEEDEMRLVKTKFSASRMPEDYYLMILPTYQCNVRCWYCVQAHEEMWMGEETVKRVKNLILNKIQQPEIKHLHLSWFGGEPLLNYKLVKEITDFCRDMTAVRDKKFSCSITTNGILLTEKRIAELKESGVTSYQITIDGTKERHDKVKVLKTKSAFETTLANINMITAHTGCALRFNFTNENLEPQEIINEIEERIDKENRKNISFLIYKVWQEEKKNVRKAEVDHIYQLAKEQGFNPRLPKRGLCYVDWENFDCVFPNGRIGKCDNGDPHKAHGVLEADGSISYPDGNKEPEINLIFDEKSECHKCSYLPICWGPCSLKRTIKQSHGKTIKCYMREKEKEMNETISNMCVNLLSATEQEV